MPPVRPPAPPPPRAAADAFRDQEKLVPTVARYIMRKQMSEFSDYDERGQRGIHPSEISKKDWCERATYYRLTGVRPVVVPHSLVMQIAFDTGSDIGRKWQNWFWEMGILKGVWRCHACRFFWEDTSPEECPKCGAGKAVIEYCEVPLFDEEHMIVGSADGDVFDTEVGAFSLVEFKSLNANTIRIEAPGLVRRYSYEHTDEDGKKHTGTDWQALWTSVRRPFPSHMRQGMLYCFCLRRERIVFIYEAKFINAWPKEFPVKFRRSLIEEELEKCVTVRTALERARPPKRPMWAEQKADGCKRCAFKEHCYARSSS